MTWGKICPSSAKSIYELANLLGTLSVDLVYWCKADRTPTSFCSHIGFAMIFTANSTFISVLYRFHIGPTKWLVSLQGFPFPTPSVWKLLSRISNLKLIEASLRAATQESRQHELLLWIESEGHNRESDRSLQPSNPINNNFCFGFCIGLISVWKLLSRISHPKLI